MIWTVVRVMWIGLARDRVAQGLSFVLPVVFFSLFVIIFTSGGGSTTNDVTVAVVDEDGTEASRRLIEALVKNDSLDVRRTEQGFDSDKAADALTRESAIERVRTGRVPVAVIVPKGFGEHFGSFGTDAPEIELHADSSDPIAPQMVGGLLQASAMQAAPDLLMQRGLEMLGQYGGGLTEAQQAAVSWITPRLRGDLPFEEDQASGGSGSGTGAAEEENSSENADGIAFSGPVSVKVVDVMAGNDENKTIVAFYAASIGAMFLLFSMAGAGGTLLEEQECGVLERVLSSRLGMGRLLAGKWIFLTVMGVIQVGIMFVWGWLAFGLELFTPVHLAGWAIMTITTAAAAAGFGLILATASRSRAQLGGISTIITILMSAMGGSMFPRFLMSEKMQQIGLCTFNAWAIDGYQKVFWYERPLIELWPQVAVLTGLTIVFLTGARLLARRWERV